jgi:hypothetical protein
MEKMRDAPMNRALVEVAGTTAEEFKEKDFRYTMSVQSTTREKTGNVLE